MTDIGIRLVDSLYEQLMVDPQWSQRDERGFTWWSYRLAQRIEAGEPVFSIDREVCPIRIHTDVVREVDPARDPARVVAAFNSRALLGALVYDPADAVIRHCAGAVAHDEIADWLAKVLAMAAVLQNADAHARAGQLAELVGGVPAATDHPVSGERPEMDEMLGVPSQVVAREGAGKSRFVGQPLLRVQKFLTELGLVGSADADGVACELPFTGPVPAALAGNTLQTALLQLRADVTHPEAGAGLLTLTRLPLALDPAVTPVLANDLNAAEFAGASGAPLLGAWCPDPGSPTTLAFAGFIPNTLAPVMLPENVIAYQASRVRFAAQALTR